MTWLLLKLGLSQRLAGIVGPLILALAAVGAILWWGHHKYRQGVDDTDAKWELASAKLKQQAAEAASAADKPSIKRQTDYAAKVAAEKEKLDEAEQSGASPLDVLFGPGGVR